MVSPNAHLKLSMEIYSKYPESNYPCFHYAIVKLQKCGEKNRLWGFSGFKNCKLRQFRHITENAMHGIYTLWHLGYKNCFSFGLFSTFRVTDSMTLVALGRKGSVAVSTPTYTNCAYSSSLQFFDSLVFLLSSFLFSAIVIIRITQPRKVHSILS
jgi:hypothetical protein